MNPSAQDWIKKFLSLQKIDVIQFKQNPTLFYIDLKSTGFIYGTSLRLVDARITNDLYLPLNHDELSKVNLLHSLIYTHQIKFPQEPKENSINSIISFYRALEKGKSGFFQKLAISQAPTIKLEHILANRLQESNVLFKASSISILTHALLYIDVLAYSQWLEKPSKIKEYAETYEKMVVSCCFLSLKSKLKKNKYEKLVIDLFESGATYIISENTFESNVATFTSQILSDAEALYILDICCLAIFEDEIIDTTEYAFLKKLTSSLKIKEKDLNKTLEDLKKFSIQNSKKLKLFEYSNPIKQFYKQSTNTVKRIILRNKDRLLKELLESKELLILLGQSTLRDLNEEEKMKVKEQLLDICKSVPSLTIFLLPGGTILLPLLVKFIPKLLPSAFDENRVKNS